MEQIINISAKKQIQKIIIAVSKQELPLTEH